LTTAGRRLGVLGGTFDPVHMGHLDAADEAHRALGLDEVLFVPAHHPPHRSGGTAASVFHRFALLSLAVADRDGFRVSDVELRRGGPSYTADTLAELHRRGWQPWQIFFIIGSDAFADVAAWHGYPSILDACHFAVIARAGMSPTVAVAPEPALRGRVRPAGEAGRENLGTAIFLVDAATTAVSSTALRTRLATNETIDGLVPPAVEHHIRRHHLYRTDSDGHGQD
jgi:nicotinate-nucleotide adenylyltransferase